MRSRASIIFAIVVTVFPFLLYMRTLCPVVFPGDSAEFAAVIHLPTLAHPPGYPLYTILGFLFTRLPIAQPVIEANILSAIFGALTILVIYITFLNLTKRPFAAAAGAMLLAFGNAFWKLSSIAEMYTLATLLMACVWWAALRLGKGGKRPNWAGFFILGLFLGLGLSNHQSIIFIIPGLALFLIMRKFALPWGKVLGAIATGLVVGLLFYLMLFPISGASSPMTASRFQGVADLWRHVTRQVYFERSPETVGEQYAGSDLVGSGDIASRLLYDLSEEWGPIFLLVAIGGLIFLIVKNRPLGLGLAVSIVFFILGLCFLTKGSPLGMPMVDLRAVDWLVIPMLPLFAFGFAAAFDGAHQKLLSSDQLVGEETFIPKEKAPFVLDIFYIALPVLLMLFNLNTADMSNHIFADRMVDNSLTGVEPPATIFTSGDEYYTFRHKISVEGLPRDENGAPTDVQLIDSKNVNYIVEGTSEILSSGESFASKIAQEIKAARRVYLTFTPRGEVQQLLTSGRMHLERVGLIFEVVPDLDPDSATGTDFIRFSNPGAEAEIWRRYDLDHLDNLENITLDPLEVPYIQRYHTEAMNYGKFLFQRAENLSIKSDYFLASSFLNRAFDLARQFDFSIDGMVRELALSNWYSNNYKLAMDVLEYAAKSNIPFPERDALRANARFSLNKSDGVKLAAEIYSEETRGWLNFDIVEALMFEDVKAEDLDAAREKALELVTRFPALLGDVAIPSERESLKTILSDSQEAGIALWHYASIASLQGDDGTFREIITSLQDVDPDFIVNKLNDLLTTGNFEKALPIYEALIEFDPQDWKAKEGLAICLQETGQEDQARELAAEVIIHRPTSPNLRRILGLEPLETEDAEETDAERE